MAITTLGLTGFEHGFIGAGAQNGGGLFDAAPGTGWSASTSSPRNGSYCARLVAPANTATRLVNNIAGAPTKIVVRFAVRVPVRPVGAALARVCYLTAGASTYVMSVKDTGELTAGAVVGPTLDTTSWYLVELQLDTATGVVKWKVNGVAYTFFSLGPTSAISEFSLGTNLTTSSGYTIEFDDVIIGTWTVTATDWYGDGKVLVQLAGRDAFGGHTAENRFSFGDAGALLAAPLTNAYTMVDDPPGTGGWTATRSTTDNLALRSTATTNAVLQLGPAPTAETGIANAVKAIMSYSSPGTQANLAACEARWGVGTGVVELWGLIGGVGKDYSESTNFFKSAIVPVPVAGWTAAEINALRFRFGMCTAADISPVPTVQALMLEVDWPIQATATPVARVSLESIATPDTDARHAIKARVRKTGGAGEVTLSAALYEGGVNRSGDLTTPALTTTLAEYTLPIPEASVANITDYSDLEVRFWANSPTGDTSISVELAKLRLEVPTSAGPQTHYGASSLAMTVSQAVAARRQTFSSLTRPVTFSAVTAGIASAPAVTHFGAASMAVGFSAATAGRRKTFGVVARPATFAAVLAGQRKTFGAVARPTAFSSTSVGQRRTFSSLTRPVTFGAVVAGIGQTPAVTHYGASSLQANFAAATAGRRKTFGVVARSTAFGAVSIARRQTFGMVARPVTFAAVSAARRQTFGSTITPVVFSAVVAGDKAAADKFGASSVSFTFGSLTQGQRKTFGQVARPFNLTAVVGGRRKTFSQVARSTSFAAVTAGQRKTFGIVARPITLLTVTSGIVTTGPVTHFGVVARPMTALFVTSGLRKTFGRTIMPLTFNRVTAGRRIVYTQVALPLTLGRAVTGSRKTFTTVTFPITFAALTRSYDAVTVLNNADAIYLGDQSVDAVYAGAEQVWP
jgi:hypothetical protein